MKKKPKSGVVIAIVAVLILGTTLCNNSTKNDNLIIVNRNTVISNDDIKLSNKEEYNIIPTVKFYVLNDEYMDNNDENNPNSTILIRDYICYDGNNEGHGISTFINLVVVPKTEKTGNILALKNAIAPDSLKLAPNTIVSEKVKKQWNEEGYRPEYE